MAERKLRLVWDAEAEALSTSSELATPRNPPPPCGEGRGWGAAPQSRTPAVERGLALLPTFSVNTTAPHPYPSPHGGGGAVAPNGGQIAPTHSASGRRSKLKFRRTRPPSLTGLVALAILIAGLVMIAQAAFIPAKAAAAQFLMQRAWEKQLATGEPARPWPWADFTPEARLSFPNQARNVLALSDAAGESLAFGPSLMAASVKPGERGVAVFAAHRDTHFAFLNRLKPGDPVIVETAKGPLTFNVLGSSVVRWDASGVHPQDGGSPRIALVTCWPLDAKFRGPMRYVVWAELKAPEQPPAS